MDMVEAKGKLTQIVKEKQREDKGQKNEVDTTPVDVRTIPKPKYSFTLIMMKNLPSSSILKINWYVFDSVKHLVSFQYIFY